MNYARPASEELPQTFSNGPDHPPAPLPRR